MCYAVLLCVCVCMHVHVCLFSCICPYMFSYVEASGQPQGSFTHIFVRTRWSQGSVFPHLHAGSTMCVYTASFFLVIWGPHWALQHQCSLSHLPALCDAPPFYHLLRKKASKGKLTKDFDINPELVTPLERRFQVFGALGHCSESNHSQQCDDR